MLQKPMKIKQAGGKNYDTKQGSVNMWGFELIVLLLPSDNRFLMFE